MSTENLLRNTADLLKAIDSSLDGIMLLINEDRKEEAIGHVISISAAISIGISQIQETANVVTELEKIYADTEGDCCVRCANPQHEDLFDKMGIGHNDH